MQNNGLSGVQDLDCRIPVSSLKTAHAFGVLLSTYFQRPPLLSI